jgi:hypothetical protein
MGMFIRPVRPFGPTLSCAIIAAGSNPVKLAELRHPRSTATVATWATRRHSHITNTLILRLFLMREQCVSHIPSRQDQPPAIHQILSLGTCNSSRESAIRQIS